MYLAKQGKIRILSKLEVERKMELTKKRKKKEFLTILLFLIVPIALLVMFTFVPFVNMVRYSLTDWDGLRSTSNLVGVDNYVQLFTRPEYKAVFKNTLYYLIGAIIQIVLALFLACLVGSKYKGADFYKGIIFFPSLLNGVAVSMIFCNKYGLFPHTSMDCRIRSMINSFFICRISSSGTWLTMARSTS